MAIVLESRANQKTFGTLTVNGFKTNINSFNKKYPSAQVNPAFYKPRLFSTPGRKYRSFDAIDFINPFSISTDTFSIGLTFKSVYKSTGFPRIH